MLACQAVIDCHQILQAIMAQLAMNIKSPPTPTPPGHFSSQPGLLFMPVWRPSSGQEMSAAEFDNYHICDETPVSVESR